jgi:hypothetical protein
MHSEMSYELCVIKFVIVDKMLLVFNIITLVVELFY